MAVHLMSQLGKKNQNRNPILNSSALLSRAKFSNLA